MMKKVSYIRISALLLFCCMLFSACGSKKSDSKVPKYALPETISLVNDEVLAEKGDLAFRWDEEQKCLSLLNNATGEIWSSIPWQYYRAGDRSNDYTAAGLCSSLYISYINSEGLEQELNSYADASFIESEAIQDGIRLTYYFDAVSISLPVEYTLNEDGITASIITGEIKEGSDKLYSVSLLPFFAGVENSAETQLFVPSGCGALMHTEDDVRESRTYSEPIYGGDASAQEMYQKVSTEAVRMPVFGSLKKDGGLLGIVESGAELASVNASAGDRQYGYSSVYAKFALRSRASALVKDVNNMNAVIAKYTEGIADINRLSVRYIVLKPEATGYMGLVSAYREYLNSIYAFQTPEKTPQVMLNILGGVQERRMLFGIPYYSTAAMTTFAETEQMLAELYGSTGAEMAVNLKGFGASGIDSGKLASGFQISNIYGKEKDFSALQTWCSQNHASLFLDFDVVYYNRSGGGYSVRKAAKSAKGTITSVFPYDIVTHEQKTDAAGANLLGRYQLARISGSLMEAVKRYSLTGVGLSTLSNVCYSDSTDALYFAGAHMSDDAARAVSALKKEKVAVMAESANLYAAALADCIINTPTKSSGYSYFDEEIPFYQMTMRGFVPVSGGIINLADDPTAEFLRSLSSGSALSFTLTYQETKRSVQAVHPETGQTVYEGLSKEIADMIRQAQPFLQAVGSSPVVSFRRDGALTTTVFANGTVIYVNFGSEALKTPIGEAAPHSFVFR